MSALVAEPSPLEEEITFFALLVKKNEQQHRASKYFQLSEVLTKRVKRLVRWDEAAALALAERGDVAGATQALGQYEEAIAIALKAARLTRRVIARGFFVALTAYWLSCLARVLVLHLFLPRLPDQVPLFGSLSIRPI